MKYLSSLNLPASCLSTEEEEYLDAEARHESWCKKNRNGHGRTPSKFEVLDAFRDILSQIAWSYVQNGGAHPKRALEWMNDLRGKGIDWSRARNYPILNLIHQCGFEPRMNSISCPFHGSDSDASLKIYTNTNSWYCYGCNKGGSPIDFIKYLTGCTVKEAAERLS